MKRVIVLGSGRQVSLSEYVKGWHACKAAQPGTVYSYSLTGWARGMPATREEILREFDMGLHDRINRHVPGYGKGRKWADEWWWEARRIARDVNTPRLVVRWVPLEFRARLAHRINLER
jgi:hypothetical protein